MTSSTVPDTTTSIPDPAEPTVPADADTVADIAAGEGVTIAGDAAPRARRNAYLPVPPEGWFYGVNIEGRTGRVAISPSDGEEWQIAVIPKGEDPRRLYASSLAEAVKVGVEAAKALDRLARIEAEYAEARKAALGAFGGGEA